jgi:hypothetical protein
MREDGIGDPLLPGSLCEDFGWTAAPQHLTRCHFERTTQGLMNKAREYLRMKVKDDDGEK